MTESTMLQKVGEETMRFMRGRYALDELGDGKDKLKFRGGGKTVLNIHICEDCYKFLLVYGKAERAQFEAARDTFPKENALVSRCGQRCDLCVHFTGGTIGEELRAELKERLERVYRAGYWGDDMRLCPGCYDQCDDVPCDQNKCAAEKGAAKCTECIEYPCGKAPIVRCAIEPKSILADDVTWAVLPFVYEQYGN